MHLLHHHPAPLPDVDLTIDIPHTRISNIALTPRHHQPITVTIHCNDGHTIHGTLIHGTYHPDPEPPNRNT